MSKGIRLYSEFGSSGYGAAALAYLQCLVANGLPIRWSPMIYTRWGMAPWCLLPENARPGRDEIIASLNGNQTLIEAFERDIDYDSVFMQTVPEVWPGLIEKGKRKIGYTVWETDRLPAHWPELVKQVDTICVPCEFNRSLFTLEGGPPVKVIPHLPRTFIRQHSAEIRRKFRKQYALDEETFVFYMISTWDPRKGVANALHAYLLAFDEDDNVCLLLKTGSYGVLNRKGKKALTRDMLDEILGNYPNPAKIVFIDENLTDDEITMLHVGCDCYFSMTHSEGWGLGAYDAATYGNPVIITGWGGQLDFLPAESSYLIEYKLQPLQETVGWASYRSDQNWAYPDIRHAADQLRNCFHEQKAAREKGRQLKEYIARHFSPEQICKALLDAINGPGPE